MFGTCKIAIDCSGSSKEPQRAGRAPRGSRSFAGTPSRPDALPVTSRFSVHEGHRCRHLPADDQRSLSVRELRQQAPTGCFTPSTRLGADPAMLMVRSMQFTLLRARYTRGEAGLDNSPDDRQVQSRPARQHGRRGTAHIGTVQVCPDALEQRVDIWLRQASVRTRGACLETGDTLFDAGDQCIVKGPAGDRMGIGNLPDNREHCERSVRRRELGEQPRTT